MKQLFVVYQTVEDFGRYDDVPVSFHESKEGADKFITEYLDSRAKIFNRQGTENVYYTFTGIKTTRPELYIVTKELKA